jgi:hypothetical protein
MMTAKEIIDMAAAPTSGTYEDRTTMEYVAIAVTTDRPPRVLELGRCAIGCPPEQKIEWEKRIWDGFVRR